MFRIPVHGERSEVEPLTYASDDVLLGWIWFESVESSRGLLRFLHAPYKQACKHYHFSYGHSSNDNTLPRRIRAYC